LKSLEPQAPLARQRPAQQRANHLDRSLDGSVQERPAFSAVARWG